MKIGRNETCPCGSGQKYKKCCAEKDAVAKSEALAAEAAARAAAAPVNDGEGEAEAVAAPESFKAVPARGLRSAQWKTKPKGPIAAVARKHGI